MANQADTTVPAAATGQRGGGCLRRPTLAPAADCHGSAGFVNRGGQGSHRNFTHPLGLRVTLSGQPRTDAHRYQEKEVRKKIDLTRP